RNQVEPAVAVNVADGHRRIDNNAGVDRRLESPIALAAEHADGAGVAGGDEVQLPVAVEVPHVRPEGRSTAQLHAGGDGETAVALAQQHAGVAGGGEIRRCPEVE